MKLFFSLLSIISLNVSSVNSINCDHDQNEEIKKF